MVVCFECAVVVWYRFPASSSADRGGLHVTGGASWSPRPPSFASPSESPLGSLILRDQSSRSHPARPAPTDFALLVPHLGSRGHRRKDLPGLVQVRRQEIERRRTPRGKSRGFLVRQFFSRQYSFFHDPGRGGGIPYKIC